MTMNPARKIPAQPASMRRVRCAIYTRKSTEEGLDQQFNSLDAQRESCEAYIRSQQHEGWEVLPQSYDDGGFTGGNMDRPALQKLMHDIAAGEIDAVVVYKVDRLSRSLLDFGRMMELFDSQKISFVSVTQQLNTATSMGRLVLNVLLSFAQFEREIISERTRDKIAATRRKGKWTGGRPVLGYRVDPETRKLVIVPEEAEQVRAIFQLYLEYGSMMPVVSELARRGWRGRSGQDYSRTTLHYLLTNPLYIGQVRYKTELHPGEHPAILDPEVWREVQSHLARNGKAGPHRSSGKNPLAGLLRCVACDRAMTPTSTSRRGRTYRYYTCTRAIHQGREACPTKPVAAGVIEEVVLAQVRRLVDDPAVLGAVLDRAEGQYRKGPRWSRSEAREKLTAFTPVWETLTPQEQGRLLSLLLERVDYDGAKGTVRIELRPGGLTSLTEDTTQREPA